MIRLERVERIGEGKLFFRKVFPPLPNSLHSFKPYHELPSP